MKQLQSYFAESAQLFRTLGENTEFLTSLQKIITRIRTCLKTHNKLLIAGNGGSAADAQHLAGEFLGHFKRDRKPLPALALSTDTSTLTAIGNDYKFADIFVRQIEALGKKGDVFISFSTSGNSKNLIAAAKKAKKLKIKTISFLGKNGGLLKKVSDISLVVPSANVPRIQEVHTLLLHIISEEIEKGVTSV